MKGTRTLLSLAVGLALASSGAHAAYVCPNDTTQLTSIPTLQGSGSSSPFATIPTANGAISLGTFHVKGIVTTLGQSLTKGFYLTDPAGDGNTITSDGIFVYLKDARSDIKVGTELCLEAQVEEFLGGTQLKLKWDGTSPRIQVLGQGKNVPVSVLKVNDDESLKQALNRHEGMRVRLDSSSDLHLTRNYGFDYKVYPTPYRQQCRCCRAGHPKWQQPSGGRV